MFYKLNIIVFFFLWPDIKKLWLCLRCQWWRLIDKSTDLSPRSGLFHWHPDEGFRTNSCLSPLSFPWALQKQCAPHSMHHLLHIGHALTITYNHCQNGRVLPNHFLSFRPSSHRPFEKKKKLCKNFWKESSDSVGLAWGQRMAVFFFFFFNKSSPFDSAVFINQCPIKQWKS